MGGLRPLYVQADDDIGKMSLSVLDAVSLAYKHNKNILVQERAVMAAKADLIKARSEFLPKLNLEAGYTHRDAVMKLSSQSAGSKDPGVFLGYEDEKRVAVSIEQSVFRSGANIANLKKAEILLKIQQEKLCGLKLAVEFETKRLYYGILLAEETHRIAVELLAQARSHYNIVKEKFAQGACSKFDLLQSKVQVSKIIPQVVRAENEKALLILEFKRLVGISSADRIVFEDSLTYSPITVNEELLLNTAYAKRPELLIKRYEIELGKKSIVLAKASGRAHIDAFLNYSYRSATVGDLFDDSHNNWFTGFVVSLPLFDGFSAKAKTDVAKIKYEQAELQSKDMEDEVAVQVHKALLELSEARAIIESQQDCLKEAKEAVRIAEARYSNGEGRNLDVLDAQVSLSQIENNLSQAIYDYIIAEAYLNRVVGVCLLKEGKNES